MIIKIEFVPIVNTGKKPDNVRDFICFWENFAKDKISQRIKHFGSVFKNGSEEAVFAELAFCIFTPQSKAVSCWKAVNTLNDKNLLLKSTAAQISNNISNVRFQNNKAQYLIEARNKFTSNGEMLIKEKLKSFNEPVVLRRWIVDNIKGIGYKEAGHFLRNIGLGPDLAILDRHILKNLKHFKAIDEIPETLTPKKYLEIEQKMIDFSKSVKIPMSHMDLLMWSMQTGGIFK